MTESDPEAVAAFADRLLVLGEGQVALEGTPRDLFYQTERLADLGRGHPADGPPGRRAQPAARHGFLLS